MKKESTKTKMVKDTPLVAKLIVSSKPEKTQGIIPFYPDKCDSATAWILAHLLQGREITQNDALFLYGTSRLSGAIHVLRHRYGYGKIATKSRTIKTRLGKSADIGVYSFPESYLSSLDSKAKKNYITEAMSAWKQAKAAKGGNYE